MAFVWTCDTASWFRVSTVSQSGMAEPPLPRATRRIAIMRDWRVAFIDVSVRKTAVDAAPPPEPPAAEREPSVSAKRQREPGRYFDGRFWP